MQHTRQTLQNLNGVLAFQYQRTLQAAAQSKRISVGAFGARSVKRLADGRGGSFTDLVLALLGEAGPLGLQRAELRRRYMAAGGVAVRFASALEMAVFNGHLQRDGERYALRPDRKRKARHAGEAQRAFEAAAGIG
jgi:hypothetical protein